MTMRNIVGIILVVAFILFALAPIVGLFLQGRIVW